MMVHLSLYGIQYGTRISIFRTIVGIEQSLYLVEAPAIRTPHDLGGVILVVGLSAIYHLS